MLGRYVYSNPGPPCRWADTQTNCRGKYFSESYATVDSDAAPSNAVIKKAFLYWTAWWKTNGADTAATLAVGGTSVGTVQADRYYVLPTSGSGGYQYSCFADVTEEVTGVTTAVNGTKFTIGGVAAVPAAKGDGSMESQAANAGWSMIIIYASDQVEGHQIYLYDQLAYLWGKDGASAEFTILGFEAPTEDRDAKLTVFAAEGDDWIDPDYTKFKGQQDTWWRALGDSNSSDPNYFKNVFNGYSSATGFTPGDLDGQPSGEISGVDIDTYTQTRTGTLLSQVVQSGDTEANIRIEVVGYGYGCDGIMLNYVVFSVRSTLVSGGEDFEVGTMSYEIN